jgi:hypothetical protein
VPVFDIPVAVKNLLGLILLSYPFVAAVVGYSSPQTLSRLARYQFRRNYRETAKERERIAYHEAGAVCSLYSLT